MAQKTLAVTYRPSTFEDMTEQESIKIILKEQLETDSIKNAYLFCGPAGCGKTTAARIFANEINKGHGNPIEMDAASNSGVEDVRNIVQNAKMKSMDSEYKVYIIDECHSISNTGWQAFLKLIEEPPAKTIFIFATTDPQKIPRTILSRVQRYDFKLISEEGIVSRLQYILGVEDTQLLCNTDGEEKYSWDNDALEYIAKLSEGHMRDAISLMDKCLAFNPDLTLENVVNALGTVDYSVMRTLSDRIISNSTAEVIHLIEDINASGKDIKQFINQYVKFLIDVQKYAIGCSFKYIQLPATTENKNWLSEKDGEDFDILYGVFKRMVKLNSNVKWSQTPKYDLEAELMMYCMEM